MFSNGVGKPSCAPQRFICRSSVHMLISAGSFLFLCSARLLPRLDGSHPALIGKNVRRPTWTPRSRCASIAALNTD